MNYMAQNLLGSMNYLPIVKDIYYFNAISIKKTMQLNCELKQFSL